MSQRSFSDTLIRLEDFKRIFVFCPKIVFFPRGKSMVFGQKMTKFSNRYFSVFYVPSYLGVSKNSFGNHFQVHKTP